MIDVLKETIIDGLKLLPFLFITYIIMELIEHKASKKTEKLIKKSGKFGPILGATLGIVPQCGFSAVAANFYAAKIITRGALIAIFLSTSDEMLPILISEGQSITLILQVLAIKLIVGIGIGFAVDLFEKGNKKDSNDIHTICEHEHCNCDEGGILKSAIKHTIQIFAYIFVISLIINLSFSSFVGNVLFIPNFL